MNKQAPVKKEKTSCTEVIFTVMLFIFILLAITFIALFFVQKLSPPVETSQRQSITTTAKNPPPVDPNYVFANGVMPTYPTVTDETVQLDEELYSANAVIVDVETGKIIAGKNTDKTFVPASMTKVMTLIVACEKLKTEDLTKRITLNAYYNNYNYNGLSTWLINGQTFIGDQIEIEKLLYGVGMVSAADCVLMLAEYTYGSMKNFVAAMNQKAVDLELRNTHFGGASGDTPEGNYTTAEDMAVIMAYAMQNPLICEILSTDVLSTYSYKSDGITKRGRLLKSTFYPNGDDDSRMNVYKELTGEAFTLKTVRDYFGKTGWLYDLPNPETQEANYRGSTLVLAATGKTTGKKYIVVVNLTGSEAYKYQGTTIYKSMALDTMKDIKYLFDTYAS